MNSWSCAQGEHAQENDCWPDELFCRYCVYYADYNMRNIRNLLILCVAQITTSLDLVHYISIQTEKGKNSTYHVPFKHILGLCSVPQQTPCTID